MEAYMNDIANDSFELSRRKASLYVEKCMMEIENDINSLEILERTSTYKSKLSKDNNDNASDNADKKESFCSRIIAKIKNILKKIRDGIREFMYNLKISFGDGGITKSEYLSSDTATLEFTTDIREIYDFIDKRYAESKPIVRMLSNFTSIDIVKMEKWCDTVNNYVVKHGTTILKSGTTYVIAKGLESLINKQNGLTSDFEKAFDRITNKSLREEEKNGNKKYSVISKFANSLFGLVELSMTTYTEISKVTGNYNKNVTRKIKRDKKRK